MIFWREVIVLHETSDNKALDRIYRINKILRGGRRVTATSWLKAHKVDTTVLH